MCIIREVYSESDERKEQYLVLDRTAQISAPAYSTPSQLLAAIEAAEHVLFACGTLVEMAEHDLANARLAQRMSRDRVMELREQLMQMEAAHG